MQDNELRLSVSKTKTYSACKKQFHYSYILKLPRKEMDYHTLGKSIHAILEYFHQSLLDGSKEAHNRLMSLAFKKVQQEYKDKLTPEMTREVYDMIAQYLTFKKHLIANVLSVEKNFALNIGTEERPIVLNGMIDRVQLDEDGVLHVVDYKSSKSDRYLKNDLFQLLVYAYILLTENPELEKVRGSYLMLRHDFRLITKEFAKEEILTIKDKILKYAEDITNETEYPANPTVLCGWCPFLELCVEGQAKVNRKIKHGEVQY